MSTCYSLAKLRHRQFAGRLTRKQLPPAEILLTTVHVSPSGRFGKEHQNGRHHSIDVFTLRQFFIQPGEYAIGRANGQTAKYPKTEMPRDHAAR